jgi:acetyl esterase/lipase
MLFRLTAAVILLLSGLFPSACEGQNTASAAQDTARQIPLWPKGAPGFENRRDEPEQAKDYWVKNIHNPSITVYLPPKDKATGAAVVIFPGGGHRLLVFDAEGRDPARFLNSIGVAAFIVKYRLFREDSAIYSFDKQTREDAYRAMRLVRSRAAEWNIDTARIGTLGFSAGGEVAALLAYTPGMGDPAAPDPIDRLNGRPNFQLLVYPGPLGIPATVPSDAPPAFLLVADNDQGASPVILSLLEKYRTAGAPVEAHILSGGNHGFNMGYRSNLKAVKNWPQQMADWLWDMHITAQPAAPPRPRPKKLTPGKNTGDLLIKVLLTIKPYPMKRQTYGDISHMDDFSPMVLNTLGTYFKKTLVNYLEFCMTASFISRSPKTSGNIAMTLATLL